jgi:hypothetical protein
MYIMAFIPVFSYVRVAKPLVFCVMFCRSLFVLLSFFCHCVVCPSIYGFWLPLWCLHTFLDPSSVERINQYRVYGECHDPFTYNIQQHLLIPTPSIMSFFFLVALYRPTPGVTFLLAWFIVCKFVFIIKIRHVPLFTNSVIRKVRIVIRVRLFLRGCTPPRKKMDICFLHPIFPPWEEIFSSPRSNKSTKTKNMIYNLCIYYLNVGENIYKTLKINIFSCYITFIRFHTFLYVSKS